MNKPYKNIITDKIVSFARYIILANHSYRHAFFTFRMQMTTIIAIAMIFVECLNYKLLFKKIEFKRKNKENKWK